jgi:hypothetical protein
MPGSSSRPSAPQVRISDKGDLSRALMLETYDSVLPPRSAIYCSAPITSGRRYLAWLQNRPDRVAIDDLSDTDRRLHRQQVIEPNRAHAKQIADGLRERTQQPVIDPTAVGPIDGWKQSDWVSFWEEVIARFAFEVVLVDGWEYSYGCTHEFWFATSRGLACRDEAGQTFGPADAARRLGNAIAELHQVGADTSKLERVLEMLKGS